MARSAVRQPGAKQVPITHKGVPFEFLTATDDPLSVLGTVLVRDQEMVLEVDCPGDPRPYTIVGKAVGSFFAGPHKGIPGDINVYARWADLGDEYAGIWVEEASSGSSGLPSPDARHDPFHSHGYVCEGRRFWYAPARSGDHRVQVLGLRSLSQGVRTAL